MLSTPDIAPDVTPDVSPDVSLRVPVQAPAPSRRGRWWALTRRDAVSARLAELDGVRGALVRAAERVEHGWVQDAWLCWVARDGSLRFSQDALPRDHVIAGVCLVSALRLADDRRAVADRAVDVCWHALTGGSDREVGLQPAPDVRWARTRDLTRWNDRSGRTPADVTDLFARADVVATAEMSRLRSL